MGYSIKTIAQKSGLSQYTLRYYEREGVLPEVARDEHGNRCFHDEDLELISLICCLKDTGMPIAEIKQFIALSKEGLGTLPEQRKLLQEHKLQIEEKIKFFQNFARKIDHKIAYFASLENEAAAAEAK
ncbi:MerR family transcriptional regulator [Paenibacillus sp. NFR01]|uniref:MerR family transcriptional regulator n=1 Tax=Paenibacillus sp. NFR01 TaxID=1566279 RepID=UPI0008B91857|nr:MerR family transcriptional regulator [Paenibacillus sp. NFR01]SEU21088.1 DNA-binding transcriptional regulator, MerR family [Paenibacillus sp. NFR01]